MSALKLCCLSVHNYSSNPYKQCNGKYWGRLSGYRIGLRLYNGSPLTLCIDPCTVLDSSCKEENFHHRQEESWSSSILGFDQRMGWQVWNSKAQRATQAVVLGWRDLWPYTLDFANRWMRPKKSWSRPYMDWGPRYGVGEDDQWPPGSNQQLYLYQSATSPTSNINREFSSSDACDVGLKRFASALLQHRHCSKMGQKHIFKWDCILVEQSLLVGLGITLFCSLNSLITYCGRRREGGNWSWICIADEAIRGAELKVEKLVNITNLKLPSPQMKVGPDAFWVITYLNEASAKPSSQSKHGTCVKFPLLQMWFENSVSMRRRKNLGASSKIVVCCTFEFKCYARDEAVSRPINVSRFEPQTASGRLLRTADAPPVI